MTSIEWFVEQLTEHLKEQHNIIIDLKNTYAFEKSEEMHKQEIIDAVSYGNKNELMASQKMFTEQYYQETFNKFTLMDETPGAPASDSTIMTNDVYEMAQEYAIKSNSPNRESRRKGFVDGYNKAQETSYTEEQIKKAWYTLEQFDGFEDFLKKLKQPKNDK